MHALCSHRGFHLDFKMRPERLTNVPLAVGLWSYGNEVKAQWRAHELQDEDMMMQYLQRKSQAAGRPRPREKTCGLQLVRPLEWGCPSPGEVTASMLWMPDRVLQCLLAELGSCFGPTLFIPCCLFHLEWECLLSLYIAIM